MFEGPEGGRGGSGAELKGGGRVPIALHSHWAQGERAQLTWHREEGWLRRDQTPHGRHRHMEGVKPEDKKFYLLPILGQV